MLIKSNKMFARTKRCSTMIRLTNFLYIFNLRQGTILIAVHQTAQTFFILLMLLVGIAHVGEMLSMLRSDMEDDLERMRDLEVNPPFMPHVVNTVNQQRFAKAVNLASVTVIFLYTATILTAVYLMCCVSLLHGAVKYKRGYVVPWIVAACLGVVLLVATVVTCDSYPFVVSMFGGHKWYHIGWILILLTFVYSIVVVASFAREMGSNPQRSAGGDERGERLMLLDHAAHSSLLSAAQINKMTSTRSQFV